MARDAYGRSFNRYGRLEFPERSNATPEQAAAKQKRTEDMIDWMASGSKLPFEQWLQEREQ